MDLLKLVHDIDWGSAPAWLGAFSLLLAFRVFLRDRGVSERAQIDQVAVWCIVREDPNRTYALELKWYYRNASNLPVRIAAAYYSVKVTWTVPSGPNANSGNLVDSEPLPAGGRAYMSTGLLPPEETVEESSWIYIDEARPTQNSSPFPPRPAECVIDRILIIDNAGRRWDFRPLSGKFARRVRFRHLMFDSRGELEPLRSLRQSAIIYRLGWRHVKYGVLRVARWVGPRTRKLLQMMRRQT